MMALGLSFVLPNYLQLVNQASALAAGLIVLPGAAIGAVLAPISGRLYDHFGPKRPIISGVLVVLLGMLVFVISGMPLSDAQVLGCYVLFMFGVGLAFGNILTTTLAQLPKQQQADGNAIMNTLQQFTAALGTAIASAIVAGGQAGRSQVVGTMLGSQWALWFLLGLAVIAWLQLTWTLRRR